MCSRITLKHLLLVVNWIPYTENNPPNISLCVNKDNFISLRPDEINNALWNKWLLCSSDGLLWLFMIVWTPPAGLKTSLPQKRKLTTSDSVPYPIPLPARLQYTKVNEMLKPSQYLSPDLYPSKEKKINVQTKAKRTKHNIVCPIVVSTLRVRSLCVCVFVHAHTQQSLDSCIPARSLTTKESEKYILCSCWRHSRPTKELLCAHSKTIQLSWAMRKKPLGSIENCN